MKKLLLITPILILFFTLFCNAEEYFYKDGHIPLTEKEVKNCSELDEKIAKTEIKIKEIEDYYKKELEKENNSYNINLQKIEEKYKEDNERLNREKNKLEETHKKNTEKIEKKKAEEENKENANINKAKKKLEEEINNNLKKEYKYSKNVSIDEILNPKPIRITREVTTEGMAAIINNDLASARDKAILDAQIKALEKVVGVFIEAQTQVSDFTNVKETISKNVKGYIESCTPIKDEIKEAYGGKLIFVTCNCVININQIFDTIQSLQCLYEEVGKPKFIVYAKSESNSDFDFAPIIETVFMNKLKEWGFNSIDSSVIKKHSRDINGKNIKNYYEVLNDYGVKLAFFINAQVIDSNSKIIDSKYLKKLGPIGNSLDIFNHKSQTYCNINIKLIDIKSGEPIFYDNFDKTFNQYFTIEKSFTNNIVNKSLSKFFYGEKCEEMRNLLFNKWADTSSKNIVSLTVKDTDIDEIKKLKEEIEKTERFFVRFNNEKFYDGTLTIDVYTNCTFDMFLDTIKNIIVNNKKAKVYSYNPEEETITIILEHIYTY